MGRRIIASDTYFNLPLQVREFSEVDEDGIGCG